MLEKSYLAAEDDSIATPGSYRTRCMGDIPFVLLMHIGAFDAEMLPRLLDLYRSNGVQLVTLEEAENDEFYRQDTDLRQPLDASTLEGLMAQRHLALPAHAMPSVQLDTLSR